ncbi:MAG: hypothetical protein ACTHJM_01420 [Marmoricola sp.]
MVAGILGWTGPIGTFLAYVMVTRGHWSAGSRAYALVNIVGGVFAGTACVLYHAWPNAVANVGWATFGLATLVSMELKRRRPALELCAATESDDATDDLVLLAS